MINANDVVRLLEAGRYTTPELVAQGGTGAVFRAREIANNRDVAIKVLELRSTAGVARIRREIAVMASIPPVPGLSNIRAGYVSDNGQLAALVSEWIHGQDLETLIQRQPVGLPLPPLLAIARQLAIAIAHLHGHGVLHRDIKPANILISANGETQLIDFGLAKGKDATELTSTGNFVGTLRFAAPEMLLGEEATVAGDAYAFGVTVLSMALGRVPLADITFGKLVGQILRGDMQGECRSVSDPTLRKFLEQLLSLSPAERPDLPAFLREFPAASDTVLDATIVQAFARQTMNGAATVPPPAPQVGQTVQLSDGPIAKDVLKLQGQVRELASALADVTARFQVADFKSRAATSVDQPDELEAALEQSFKSVRGRLSVTWGVGLAMTIILFTLFVSMAVVAILLGAVYKQSGWSIVFGAGGAVSALTVLLWRPMDKMFFTTITVQQLELIQVSFRRALSAPPAERRQAVAQVTTELNALLERVSNGAAQTTPVRPRPKQPASRLTGR